MSDNKHEANNFKEEQLPGNTTATNQLANMEVHHHPHLPHGKKGFKEYFLEFLMIFLAVTLGFIAENLREGLTDSKKEKEYIHSLVADLKEDTTQIAMDTKYLFRNIRGDDSLINWLQHYSRSDSSNKQGYVYYLRYTLNMPQMLFSERSITQLLNTGNMRLISNPAISDSILTYYNKAVKAVNIEGVYYNEQFKKAMDYSTNIFDFNYARTPLKEDFTFIPPRFDTAHFIMLTTDPLLLKKYQGNIIMLQNLTGSYVFMLKYTGDIAKRLIALLKKEYKLE